MEEIERIRIQNPSKDWSAQIIETATIADLSEEAISVARKNYKRKNAALATEVDEWTDTTFLNKAKITIKGCITNTAILLLGKPESAHFINPATPTIIWILRDRDNLDKDYAHFSCPLILNTEKVYEKVRNLKYRYIREDTLFPDEVDQYDPYIIREALNNCIADQDYQLAGKINLVEFEDGKLVFNNAGKFIPESVEEVVISDAPEPTYRNPFLVEAMINLNMIDAIGSGIKRMYIIQKNKFFPLPDYDTSNNKVKVTIIGKVVDIKYARKLATLPELELYDIIALDKVAKGRMLSNAALKSLKAKKLIEGRKPNYFISATVAALTGEKAKYIKQRGFKDEHYKKMILKYIDQFGSASRSEIRDLIKDQLATVLTEDQKTNKIRNLLQAMSKNNGSIKNSGTNRYPKWERV